MMELTPYSKTTRDKFDREARQILDALCAAYPRLEIEGPNERDGPTKWFVQIYRNREQEIPEGFYGSTVVEAASHVASAVGLSISDTDQTDDDAEK